MTKVFLIYEWAFRLSREFLFDNSGSVQTDANIRRKADVPEPTQTVGLETSNDEPWCGYMLKIL